MRLWNKLIVLTHNDWVIVIIRYCIIDNIITVNFKQWLFIEIINRYEYR